ncbi:MAG: branched-chain amino acid ABC transporter permease [Roseitalea porphyridii]|jgi:branched-chain amino acid transport system permease protein|nr:branched-chain amino acid ABC transporter permease [Roseitalea porphyridii]
MITGNLKASYAADERVLDNGYKQGFVLAAAALCALMPFIANDYIILVASQMGIMLIAVVGVNVVIGYTGLLSLGHAAFMAIGAYSVPILHRAMAAAGLPDAIMPFIAIPGAIALSALVGIVVGLPSLRVKGLYLAVATLSANFIIIFLIELEALAPWTGGLVGLNTPDANLLGWELDTQREMFALIAALAFVTILAVQNLFRTRVGRAFIAIRERDYSAEILGISLLRYKLMSFAISAACCGLAGALFAYFYARILPEQFELALSLQLVAALIVGGMGRTMGPVFGVIIIVMVPEILKFTFGAIAGGAAEVAQLRAPIQEIIFGLLIIFFLLFEPMGINHLVDRGLRALNRWPFARG